MEGVAARVVEPPDELELDELEAFPDFELDEVPIPPLEPLDTAPDEPEELTDAPELGFVEAPPDPRCPLPLAVTLGVVP